MSVHDERIGKLFTNIHNQIYGKNKPPGEVFRGGNVGPAILGFCIIDAAEKLANSIDNFSKAITQINKEE